MRDILYYGATAKHLQLAGHPIEKTIFPDGEISIRVAHSVENRVVCYVQSTAPPVHDHLFELLMTVAALKQMRPKKMILMMPYFGYSRQNRLEDGGSIVSAQVVAELIGRSGIDALITLDLHAPELVSVFPVPVYQISPECFLLRHIVAHVDKQSCVLVAPDKGAVARVQRLGRLLNMGTVILDKTRMDFHSVYTRHVVGAVSGKHCLIVDDMIDSGKTLIAATEQVLKQGATGVHALATHGVFSGRAIANLADSPLQSVTVSNSIDQARLLGKDKFKVINLQELISFYAKREKKTAEYSVLS